MKPLDRDRGDSALFQFTTRRLRGFVNPDHLLIRIDEQFDFGKLVATLEDRYCPDDGRPAIHPEVMIRALLICSLYNIPSFRRLSSVFAENITYQPVSERPSMTGEKVNCGQSCSKEEVQGVQWTSESAGKNLWRSTESKGRCDSRPER